MPKLLPLEFLDDPASDEESDDEEGEGSGDEGARKRRKKLTLEDRLTTAEQKMKRKEKGPRDEMVGSTVYRVAKTRDERLPPKVTKYAQGQKAALMRRDRPVVKARSGFVVKK